MTQAPHLLMNSREGYKYGDVTVLDHMAYDGLHDVFTDQPMGALTEQRNDADKFTRLEQDEFAAGSHQKAAAAWKDGVFADEVCRWQIPQRKGDPIEFAEDEGIRANTTVESLAASSPHSARTAPSRPARRRRSPTAAPSWS
jgi:acetyl-CoA C-acetyltransferase